MGGHLDMEGDTGTWGGPGDVGGTWGAGRVVADVLWTGLPCPNFHLLLSCALLEGTRDTGDDGDSGDDGDTDEDGERDEAPPGRWPALDAEEALSRAEGLFLQLAAAPDLPPTLQELLGLGGPPPSPPPEPLHPETAGGPPDPHPEYRDPKPVQRPQTSIGTANQYEHPQNSIDIPKPV
ncbi:TBC1 domain family member 17-like [Sarcoramphus papa]